jgi:NAD+ kinase
MRNGEEINAGIALNDVVVHKWNVAHMIETDTYINEHFVHTHRSDGIITATPTGSTAYALSGGGPIIQPGLEALEIVPICPHTLSNRPIAVKSSSKVRIVLSETGRNKGQVTCDGQFLHELEIGDEILIEKKAKRLQLLHPKGYDYYHILRAKLHWAEHP